MMNFEDFEEKTLSRENIFKGKVIDVKYDTVALPGTWGLLNENSFFITGVLLYLR
jgi:ADP-ribose pyrophosphatase